LLGAGQACERFLVRFLHGDRQVLHDRLCLLGVVALGSRRLLGFVKLKLMGADANCVAVDDGGFIDLLAVDECAVAASLIANHPAVARARQRRVDARRKRIGKRDVAIGAAADERFAAGIEGKIRAGAVAGEDRQIGVEATTGDGHRFQPAGALP
jgi:hypothetical protein